MNRLLLLLLLCIISVRLKSQSYPISLADKNGALIYSIKGKPILSYQYETVHPKPGIDPANKKSGFLHPVRTPKGHSLTLMQAEDHPHHYGLWDAWTHVLFEGDTLDFWNLAKKQGTVRFVDFEEKTENGFIARQAHVVLKNGLEKTALNERFSVKVIPGKKKYYMIDIELEYSCATPSPFHILEYRYAGFCWRTTEAWQSNNSKVLASEGQSRREADASRAKWFLVQGELGTDYGGGLLLSHPDNYNHPEPMRIWPESSEDIMAMFAPSKDRDWIMEPGKQYVLKYRFVAYDGRMRKKRAERFWREYTLKFQ